MKRGLLPTSGTIRDSLPRLPPPDKGILGVKFPEIGEGTTRADRRRDCKARRHRNTVRPALRREGHRPDDRPVHRGESLSPRRSLPNAPPADATEATATVPIPTTNFGQMIPPNLRKVGAKGTDKSQRITFARLDPFPGEYVQAEGEAGTGAAVRVCVGPESVNSNYRGSAGTL